PIGPTGSEMKYVDRVVRLVSVGCCVLGALAASGCGPAAVAMGKATRARRRLHTSRSVARARPSSCCPGTRGQSSIATTPRNYYPQTNFVSDTRLLAERFKVPVLVLAGERDCYHNCCVIESMRAMEATARVRQAPFELVVYPFADHGFN